MTFIVDAPCDVRVRAARGRGQRARCRHRLPGAGHRLPDAPMKEEARRRSHLARQGRQPDRRQRRCAAGGRAGAAALRRPPGDHGVQRAERARRVRRGAAAGPADILITGANGTESGVAAVEAGEIAATWDLLPWKQGVTFVNVLKALVDGETVEDDDRVRCRCSRRRTSPSRSTGTRRDRHPGCTIEE